LTVCKKLNVDCNELQRLHSRSHISYSHSHPSYSHLHAIPIPMAGHIPIPMGIPWDPGLSHSHAHLYLAALVGVENVRERALVVEWLDRRWTVVKRAGDHGLDVDRKRMLEVRERSGAEVLPHVVEVDVIRDRRQKARYHDSAAVEADSTDTG